MSRQNEALDLAVELAKFVESVNCDEDSAEFCCVKLTAVRQNVIDAFHTNRSTYVNSASTCLRNRFDDLQSSAVI